MFIFQSKIMAKLICRLYDIIERREMSVLTKKMIK